ncbi:branched-chain amino acid:cation transporter, LIVCS family [Oceanobacillus limi]|uniref:Branched-chain amino acid transport system carrier protein n=1 Tax=Oceanobacillus limi TaxID=930131 RepID=A0A1I0GWY6_9BACI|nr:branched-chain amino acid transport system II carrier protein [Oceanobacillus limi]SET75888.1 branched-chain amino acid:cation transporter, LIVCS family [Oceanobacillus limi]
MNKDTFTIGFMLFALFFGAGNLIYPPTLGMESGTSYWAAIFGFVITGVGLPILGVTAISYVQNDARELADRVHPAFGLIFTSVVYLAIAPFFGIPRAATVGYEMSVVPFAKEPSSLSLFIFTTIFFLLVYLISLNPSKMVNQIGQLLTPILLLAIVALSIGGFILIKNPLGPPAEKYQESPFFTGFVEGYLTMDAIAAVAFGIIVVNAFKERGMTNHQELFRSTLKAGLITGIGLFLVYASIGWIGASISSAGTYTNGGDILSSAARIVFGDFGVLLLGIIVTLACFTTSVGLVVAAGQFFTKVTKIPYKWLALVITAGSYLIANQGLNTIIKFSIPVLTFIYPIAIVLIALTFMHRLFGGRTAVYRWAILFTAMISLYDGLIAFGFKLDNLTTFLAMLPFFEIGLGWLIPAIAGGLLGFSVQRFVRNDA